MKVALIQMNSGADKMANLAAARELIERAVLEEKPIGCACRKCSTSWAARARKSRLRPKCCPAGRHGPCCAISRASMGSSFTAVRFSNRFPAKIASATPLSCSTARARSLRYRKIHMFDITAPDGQQYNESAAMKPGEAVVTYDVEGVTVGCSICYDLRFPDLFQALVARGAQMIALPAAFTLQTGKDHWEVLLRARAIETETYMCAAGQTECTCRATSSARPMVIRSSPIHGDMWSRAPPTA